jgi:7-carboxy-7-deazaguanine synthase
MPTMLPVNEIFETLQGEATFTGTPSVFVRLQGCDVGCPWCDTKHTWEMGGQVIKAADMVAKDHDDDRYAALEPGQLVDLVLGLRSRHIVLTGGEPCMYDLTEVTGALAECGRSVQIETSGTYQINAAPRTWITLSPKIGMPGGLVVLPRALHRANEVKMPVGKPADVDKLLAFLDGFRPAGGVWLQPLSQSKKATVLCVDAAAEHGFRVSLQTHKTVGLR